MRGSPPNSYQQSIERMQQSISRLDQQLSRSRQLLSHDITIDNRSKQDLNFVIKIEEENQANSLNKSQSRVCIPHQSTYHHRVSTTPRQHSSSQKQSYFKNINTSPIENQQNSTYRYQTYTPKDHTTSVKFERKFQPISRIEEQPLNYSSYNSFTPRHPSQFESSKSHKFTESIFHSGRSRESKVSQRINSEGSVNYIPSYLQTQNKPQPMEQTETIRLPILISEERNNCSQAESPQVFNYLTQQSKSRFDHGVYSSANKMQQGEAIHVRSVMKESELREKKREQNQWRVQPLSIGYQSNKKYFEEVKEREMLSKIKKRAEERKRTPSKDWDISSPQTKSKSQYIANFETPSHNKGKANDLFLQRKSMFMKNLQKSQERQRKVKEQETLKSRPKVHSFSSNNLVTSKKDTDKSQSKQMSDKVKQISQRLYSRSKEKLCSCEHYQKHGESIERDRFYGIVDQNSFVQKYVSKEQQQQLFQILRRDKDSVSSWPMKILNYTYGKLQKINSGRYTIRKVYQ